MLTTEGRADLGVQQAGGKLQCDADQPYQQLVGDVHSRSTPEHSGKCRRAACTVTYHEERHIQPAGQQ